MQRGRRSLVPVRLEQARPNSDEALLCAKSLVYRDSAWAIVRLQLRRSAFNAEGVGVKFTRPACVVRERAFDAG
jgi:hypothetical protein